MPGTRHTEQMESALIHSSDTPPLGSYPLEGAAIFLSHTMADRKFVIWLSEELSERGARVLTAFEDVLPGVSFAEQIGSLIDQNNVVIVVLSRSAEESPWLSVETALAMSGQVRLIIPLRLDKGAYVPPLLRQYQYSDFSDRTAREKALTNLERSIHKYLQTVHHPQSVPRHSSMPQVLQAQQRALEIEAEALAVRSAVREDAFRRFFVTYSLIAFLSAMVFIFLAS